MHKGNGKAEKEKKEEAVHHQSGYGRISWSVARRISQIIHAAA